MHIALSVLFPVSLKFECDSFCLYLSMQRPLEMDVQGMVHRMRPLSTTRPVWHVCVSVCVCMYVKMYLYMCAVVSLHIFTIFCTMSLKYVNVYCFWFSVCNSVSRLYSFFISLFRSITITLLYLSHTFTSFPYFHFLFTFNFFYSYS